MVESSKTITEMRMKIISFTKPKKMKKFQKKLLKRIQKLEFYMEEDFSHKVEKKSHDMAKKPVKITLCKKDKGVKKLEKKLTNNYENITFEYKGCIGACKNCKCKDENVAKVGKEKLRTKKDIFSFMKHHAA